MANEIYAGVFRGRKLVQTSGEIGGARSVFVKVKGIKNELVYPTFGGKIMNPPKGNGFKFYAGDLFEFRTNDEGVNPELYLLKTYLVESVNGTIVNIVNDGYKHKPFVGDVVGVAPSAIGGTITEATITKVESAKVGDVAVWACTLSAALSSAKKGDILVEGDGKGKMLVKAINAVADSDGAMLEASNVGDEFEAARYYYTPALGGIMYTKKMSPMPACVLAENESKINGWFQIKSI